MATKFVIGSTGWIATEKENVHELVHQEREDIVFPAQHEMGWLNEHMSDIFNDSFVDVANVFKTPGKLKGKTPRTVRKRALDERAPLSDVFSLKPQMQQSPNKTKQAAQFKVAQDQGGQSQHLSQSDSGYQGSSQVEGPSQRTPELPVRSPLRTIRSPIIESREVESEVPTTEGSFHSAKENQTIAIKQQGRDDEQKGEVNLADIEMQDADVAVPQFDDIGSPSDESTPDRPPMRKKSSMAFASLPAREPLSTSTGARVSRTSHLISRIEPLSGHQQVRPQTALAQDQDDVNIEMTDNESNIEILGIDESEVEADLQARQYSKASTQRLHERIDALGKTMPPRTSKSIPPTVPRTHQEAHVVQHALTEGDDDDWIRPLCQEPQKIPDADMDGSEDEFDIRAPELIAHEERMKLASPPQRPILGHIKSASTATLQSPAKARMGPPPSPAKSISVSNPAPIVATPQDSPSRFIDGPISASKSKLASIMKTAKGLFTSSASVSAAAKMETLPSKQIETTVAMYPNVSLLEKPLPASPPKDGRRTRSSTEREKEERKKQKDLESARKTEDQLQKAREKEKQKTAQQKPPDSPRKEDRVPTAAPKTIRPGRDISKTKPQPMSIKVGTMSQRINPGQDILQAEPKRPGLTKKASTTSLQSSSSNSTFKSSVTSQPNKPKALLAAERKKEQDERDAQRKLDQKKENERKRAAQQEEIRKQEQEQRAEIERKERERIAAERAKRQAQQAAIERKRQDALRKADQQRVDRVDPGIARPPSRLGQQPMGRSLMAHPLPTNPAKPAKRPVEEDNVRPQPPRFGAVTQQTDAKRRRTEDEVSEPQTRPTMSGAPIRQSQMGKKPSIFSHPTYQQASSSLHLSNFPQPPRAQPQMSQFANSKIPFAEPSSTGPAKTPLSAYQHRTIQAVKSSPHYQNGESIHLPEIPTDSEDEDSENEGNAFPIPDWATPGHLTEQLIRQEAIDGDAVFGPIAPLKMEEIFSKGNKERLKRLRDRTSSANWALSGDGLTLEEVKADREQRERMRLQGGWQYSNGL